MPKSDIVIGFDPGLAITGYGIIQDKTVLEYGVLRTPAKHSLSERLVLLNEQLQNLLSRYTISRAGCEKLFFARNVTTAFDVGQARGIILLNIALHNIPLLEVTPLQVKHCMTGYGKADKQQIQYMVQATFGLSELPKPDDAADALAIALTTQQYVSLA
ncbi:MAG: crossover junction endodeoxyribonuclease RuvC [Patescibacteria group bacterium]|jgi:crossover junction endodeoxyribonuclease RuvC